MSCEIDQAVKQRAYVMHPSVWQSYSGMSKTYKQFMNMARADSLNMAAEQLRLEQGGLDESTEAR